jgi:PhoPQ-activated pathogenicity-related protein
MILKLLINFFFISLSFCLPLDDYINKEDNYFEYKELSTINGIRWKGQIFNMTSQKWLSEKYVDRSIWWHYVVSIVPDELEFNDKSIVFIGGGSNTDDIPNIENDLVILGSKLALNTKSIVTVLFQIPNQPLLFYDDELQSHRKEDAAVAFTWYHFLKNPFESN